MKTYYLYWLDGKKDVKEAESIAQAFTLLGYGQGALPALEVYSEDSDDFEWDEEQKKWFGKKDVFKMASETEDEPVGFDEELDIQRIEGEFIVTDDVHNSVSDILGDCLRLLTTDNQEVIVGGKVAFAWLKDIPEFEDLVIIFIPSKGMSLINGMPYDLHPDSFCLDSDEWRDDPFDNDDRLSVWEEESTIHFVKQTNHIMIVRTWIDPITQGHRTSHVGVDLN